jgi:hypothetical protein
LGPNVPAPNRSCPICGAGFWVEPRQGWRDRDQQRYLRHYLAHLRSRQFFAPAPCEWCGAPRWLWTRLCSACHRLRSGARWRALVRRDHVLEYKGIEITVPYSVGSRSTQWAEIQAAEQEYFGEQARAALEAAAREGWEPDEPIDYPRVVSRNYANKYPNRRPDHLRIRVKRVKTNP